MSRPERISAGTVAKAIVNRSFEPMRWSATKTKTLMPISIHVTNGVMRRSELSSPIGDHGFGLAARSYPTTAPPQRVGAVRRRP